jgi:hypothetical protein
MTVAASDLASGHLRVEPREAPLAPGHRRHVARLSVHVVELEDGELAAPAVDATRRGEPGEHPREVARTRRAFGHPRVVEAPRHPRPAPTLRRDAPVAVRASHLAARDLPEDLLVRAAAGDQVREPLRALADMVELEDRKVGLAAVDARMCLQVPDDRRAGTLRTPSLRRGDLPAVPIAPRCEVRAEAVAAPVLMPGRSPIERGQRQRSPASTATLLIIQRHERMFAPRSDGSRATLRGDGGSRTDGVAAGAAAAAGAGGGRAGDHRRGGVVPARASVP